jgi:quinol monooxygenase YgiN
MEKESIRVVARITARPERVAELSSVLQGLVGPTRKEAGCISYQLLRNKSDASDFVFVEEWANDAVLEAHFTTPHLRDALAKAKPLLAADPDIRRYSTVE